MARTVVIVDDHPSFRSSARMLLESDGFEVVGEAATGEEGVDVALELRPDLVLLDVNLPDIDGFEVATRITADPAPPSVILTSSRDSTDFGPLVQKSGALGFVPKSELSGAALEDLLQ
ncbi:MAG TPA: response regulator transcription factor [Thermoleophilaceae bacterium]